jgi:hypothetical protein
MPINEIDTVFDGRPHTREEKSFSISPTGHVFVNLRQLFESDEVRRKLSNVARQVHSQSEKDRASSK